MEKHRLCQSERRMLGGPRWLREQALSWFLLLHFSGVFLSGNGGEKNLVSIQARLTPPTSLLFPKFPLSF